MPTDTDYQRRRRREARANGMCGICWVRQAEHYRCTHCADLLAKQPYRVSRIARDVPKPDSFCIDCQAHGRHRADCPTQRKERAA